VSWGECTVGSQPLSPFCIPDAPSLMLTRDACGELGELVLLVRGGGASAFAGVGWECRWFLKYDKPRSRLGRVGEVGVALEVDVCVEAVAGTAAPNMLFHHQYARGEPFCPAGRWGFLAVP